MQTKEIIRITYCYGDDGGINIRFLLDDLEPIEVPYEDLFKKDEDTVKVGIGSSLVLNDDGTYADVIYKPVENTHVLVKNTCPVCNSHLVNDHFCFNKSCPPQKYHNILKFISAAGIVMDKIFKDVLFYGIINNIICYFRHLYEPLNMPNIDEKYLKHVHESIEYSLSNFDLKTLLKGFNFPGITDVTIESVINECRKNNVKTPEEFYTCISNLAETIPETVLMKMVLDIKSNWKDFCYLFYKINSV